jgi:hypothetical protein
MDGVVLVLGLAAPIYQSIQERQGLPQLGPHAVRGLQQIIADGVGNCRTFVIIRTITGLRRRMAHLIPPPLLEAREPRPR